LSHEERQGTSRAAAGRDLYDSVAMVIASTAAMIRIVVD
jgi:hypothetical protein